jgi:hypothetical protein
LITVIVDVAIFAIFVAISYSAMHLFTDSITVKGKVLMSIVLSAVVFSCIFLDCAGFKF